MKILFHPQVRNSTILDVLLAATLAVSLIATGGCASRPTMPDWVNGPAEKYPGERIFVLNGARAMAGLGQTDIAKEFIAKGLARFPGDERLLGALNSL